MSVPFDAARAGTEIQRRLGIRTSRDEPLARFTTMRVGGPADLYAAPVNAFELRAIVRLARGRDLPHTILGRGSNVVVSDAGVRGLLIHVRAQGFEIADGRLVADAGLPMAKAATVTAEAGLSGLEFGLAIPGNVGGAVWANAGAHDSDVAAILESARVLGSDGSEASLAPGELGLAYRESRFKHGADGRPADVILGATFRLAPDDPAAIRAEQAQMGQRQHRRHRQQSQRRHGRLSGNETHGMFETPKRVGRPRADKEYFHINGETVKSQALV